MDRLDLRQVNRFFTVQVIVRRKGRDDAGRVPDALDHEPQAHGRAADHTNCQAQDAREQATYGADSGTEDAALLRALHQAGDRADDEPGHAGTDPRADDSYTQGRTGDKVRGHNSQSKAQETLRASLRTKGSRTEKSCLPKIEKRLTICFGQREICVFKHFFTRQLKTP